MCLWCDHWIGYRNGSVSYGFEWLTTGYELEKVLQPHLFNLKIMYANSAFSSLCIGSLKLDSLKITHRASLQFLQLKISYFQGHTLTRNARSPEMYQLEAVFLPVLVTVLKWWGPSLFDATTCIMLRNTRGEKWLSYLKVCLFLFLHLRTNFIVLY